jgi:hypothetical protein
LSALTTAPSCADHRATFMPAQKIWLCFANNHVMTGGNEVYWIFSENNCTWL